MPVLSNVYRFVILTVQKSVNRNLCSLSRSISSMYWLKAFAHLKYSLLVLCFYCHLTKSTVYCSAYNRFTVMTLRIQSKKQWWVKYTLNFGNQIASQINRLHSIALIHCADNQAASNSMHKDGDSYCPARQCRGSGSQLSACPEADWDPLPGFVVVVVAVGQFLSTYFRSALSV